MIIISSTYGIGKDRKFAQRFGPLTHSKGYKLLNVIITRAKYKIYVCSSIPEQAFMNFKDYLVTEGTNNKKAVLYAYLAYCKAVSERNHELRLSVLTSLAENTSKSVSVFDQVEGLESPFEEEVFQCLSDRLGKECLIPQYRFGGFRIDIVYDPKKTGVPKIAIECDGAKFHTEREAYLHDRHRQKILEAHGFKFHRIWSTNWWRNSTRELDRLVDYIEQITSASDPKLIANSSAADAFTDNISLKVNHGAQTSFMYEEQEDEIIQTLNTTIAPPKPRRKEVESGSKVHVRYVNNGKDIVVHLVQSENNKNDRISGVQKIYNRSPLATSLIGKCEGDIVKVGNLDNFVEIVAIN